MLKSTAGFIHYPHKRLLLTACAKLMLFHLLIKLTPEHWLAQTVSNPSSLKPCAPQNQAEQIVIVKRAIKLASQKLPFNFLCLCQALTAQNILSKHGIASTLYFGVANGTEQKLQAHAWVKSDHQFVTGQQGHHQYSVIGKFSNHTRSH